MIYIITKKITSHNALKERLFEILNEREESPKLGYVAKTVSPTEVDDTEESHHLIEGIPWEIGGKSISLY